MSAHTVFGIIVGLGWSVLLLLTGFAWGVRACTRSLRQQMAAIERGRQQAAYRALFDEEMP